MKQIKTIFYLTIVLFTFANSTNLKSQDLNTTMAPLCYTGQCIWYGGVQIGCVFTSWSAAQQSMCSSNTLVHLNDASCWVCVPAGSYNDIINGNWCNYKIGVNKAGATIANFRCAGCKSPPGDMVAWYSFDETNGGYSDDWINSNYATWYHAPVPDCGKVFYSMKFNGSNTYLEANDIPALNFGPASSFSIDFWMKCPTTSQNGNNVIIDKRTLTGSKYKGYGLVYYYGSMLLQLADGTTGGGWTNLTKNIGSVSDNQWHHIAITVKRNGPAAGQIITWYCDAVNKGTTPIFNVRNGNLTNTGNLVIGERYDHAAGYFNGSLDELQMYSRDLTAAEIQGIFSAGPFGNCKP